MKHFIFIDPTGREVVIPAPTQAAARAVIASSDDETLAEVARSLDRTACRGTLEAGVEPAKDAILVDAAKKPRR